MKHVSADENALSNRLPRGTRFPTGVTCYHFPANERTPCRPASFPSRCSTPTTTSTRPKEALTKFLPDNRKHAIDYVDVRGRTKIVVRGQISEYIPNPTFEVVARPGAQEEYYRNGNGGKSYREIMGKPMKAIPAFREPGPRLEVMDELGLDYALMFPTLASLVEERMKDDPEMIHDVIHALNQWMYETWSFNYKDRIFATPVITLPIVDRALEELEWCLERGAKTVLVRPAPVPGFRGTRSFGLPEFDPFWQACVEGRHPGVDARLGQRLRRVPQRVGAGRRVPAVQADLVPDDRDGQAPDRGRDDRAGLPRCAVAATRTCASCPSRTAPSWVPYLLNQFADVYSKMPQEFLEDPIEAFKRCVYVAPFWEDNFAEIVDIMGADRVHVRLGLAAPRGPGGADPPGRPPRGPERRGSRKDHGRQPDGAVQGR